MAARLRSAPRGALLLLLGLGLVLSGCDASSGGAGGSSAAPSTSPEASAASPAAAEPRFGRYVALGDSYTAAPGVPGRQSDDGCLRSSRNYPHLLASALPITRLVDVSCSGADTGDMRTRQLRGVRPQLAAVTRDTDLVTIGLGGNDQDLFIRLVTTCLRQDPAAVAGTPCADSLKPSVAPILRQMQQDLVQVVRDVRGKAPSARIVLVGYPQIVPASGTCADVPFAPADYRFAHQVNHGLTEAVRQAAAASRATYVDVWRASADHDICAAEPWINGLNGPGAAPFHPFAAEQAAVARLVAAAVA
jgi:lysophospholipase L1-like esterase